MSRIHLAISMVCVLSLFVGTNSLPIHLRKMQRSLDHIFTEMGKFRRDISFMELRIDSLEETIHNMSVNVDIRNSKSSTDTRTLNQPAIVEIEAQAGGEKEREKMKLLMDNAIRSLSNEKLLIRNMLKDLKQVVRNGKIGDDVDERIRAIEDKIKENPVQVVNPGNGGSPVVLNSGDVQYSFSARLGKSLEIHPDPNIKRLGHKMHSKRIQFGDVIHNDGNVYNPISGKFTCMKTGVYLFVYFVEGHFRKLHGVSGQTSMLAISVDGKYQTLAASKAVSEDGRNTGGNSIILKLSKGQQVWLDAVAPITQTITLREWVSTFSGTLLY